MTSKTVGKLIKEDKKEQLTKAAQQAANKFHIFENIRKNETNLYFVLLRNKQSNWRNVPKEHSVLTQIGVSIKKIVI